MSEGWVNQFHERWERLKEWFNSFRRRDPAQQYQPSSGDNASSSPQPAGDDDRYDVQMPGGGSVLSTNSLEEALGAWRSLTNQEGSIIDSATGEDLTPEKDDTGRYAVLDEDGQQVGTFDEFAVAERVWEDQTDSKGMIVDTHLKKDVTPYSGLLSDEEVQEAVELVQAALGDGYGYSPDRFDHHMKVDPDEVARLIEIINKRRLPVFDLANAVGDGGDMPTKTVTVTKREAVVQLQPEPYYEEVPIHEPPFRLEDSDESQDMFEMRPMDSVDELPIVDLYELVMPGLDERLAKGDLPVRQDKVEVPGDVPTRRVRRTRMKEVIVPREWEEEIEVTEDSRVQNLALVVDYSPSMSGINLHVAVALTVVLVTKHLRDESRYSFRWFANHVDDVVKADSNRTKRNLIEFVMSCTPLEQLGGGTYIMGAIEAASRDVRSLARRGEIPEVLVITDGQDDMVTAEALYRCLGRDVVLHTVVIGGDNYELRQHSSTYERIDTHHLGGPFQYGFDTRHHRW